VEKNVGLFVIQINEVAMCPQSQAEIEEKSYREITYVEVL